MIAVQAIWQKTFGGLKSLQPRHWPCFGALLRAADGHTAAGEDSDAAAQVVPAPLLTVASDPLTLALKQLARLVGGGWRILRPRKAC